MIKKFTLLMIAADYVNGLSLNNIILNPKLKIFNKVYIITVKPSSKIILIKNSIKYYKLDKLNEMNLKKKSEYFINLIKPNAVISGINGPDFNIDEIMINLCKTKKIQTFSIQNFWGDINFKYKNIADTIFLIDKYALFKTKKIIGNKANLKVVGSINHENYNQIKFKNVNKFKSKRINLLFCIQPFLEKNYYHKILINFLLEINKYDYDIYIRPHPANSTNYIKKIFNDARKLNISIKLNKSKNINNKLMNFDFIVSFFSTANYDAINLIKYSKGFKIIPVYLFYDIEIRNIYNAFTKLDRIPIKNSKEAFIVNKYSQIHDIFNPNLIKFKKNLIKKYLYNKTNIKRKVSTKILSEIYRSLNN